MKELSLGTGAPSNFFNDLVFDTEKRAVFATDDGLLSYNGAEFQVFVPNKVVSNVARDRRDLYFSCEDTVFQKKGGTYELYFVHKTAVRDIAFLKGRMFVLGQEDWGVYENGTLLYSGECSGGRQLVKHQSEMFMLDDNGVSIWKNQTYSSFISTNKPVLYGAPTSKGNWLLITENSIFQSSVGSTEDPSIATIKAPLAFSANGDLQCVVTADSVYLIQGERIRTLHHDELQGNVSACYVDSVGGIWFLTQGGGCFYAESVDIVHYKSSVDQFSPAIDTKNRLPKQYDKSHQLVYSITNHQGILVVDEANGNKWFLDIASGLSHNYVKSWTMKQDTLFVIPKRGEINTIVNGSVVNTPESILKNSNGTQLIAFDSKEHVLYFYNVNGRVSFLGEDGVEGEYGCISSARVMAANDGCVVLVANDRCEMFHLKEGRRRILPLPQVLSSSEIGFEFDRNSLAYVITDQAGYTSIPLDAFSRDGMDNVVIANFYVDGQRRSTSSDVNLPYGAYIFRIEVEQINYSQFGKAPLTVLLQNGSKKILAEVRNGAVEFPVSGDGTYSLSINSTKSKGQTINILIEIPFWQSIWFWFIIVASIVVLSSLIAVFRTYRMRKEQRRLQLLVDQRTASLQSRNKDVEQIAYALSHDFKSPLSTMVMLAEMSNDSTLDDVSKKQSLELLQSKCKDLSVNMNGLIELVQIGTTHMPIETVNMLDVLEAILSSLEMQIKDKNVAIQVNVSEEMTLIGVRAYLYSILHNLIANAVKYSDPNKDSYVTVSAAVHGNFSTISIEDNGIGMSLDEELRANLFRPFKQLDSRSEGVGLGLSIVKRMVEVHHGSIELESETGKGTRFDLKFPTKS